MDRLQRSSNIIIYNLAPQSDTCDKDLVSNCLNNINNINIAEISVKRFKKQSPRSIVPPIIATLSSNVDVKRILKNWKKYPKGIQITPDYTVCQRNLYKSLKEESVIYNRVHPDNQKVVKYINGNPTLIESKKSNTSRNNFRTE